MNKGSLLIISILALCCLPLPGCVLPPDEALEQPETWPSLFLCFVAGMYFINAAHFVADHTAQFRSWNAFRQLLKDAPQEMAARIGIGIIILLGLIVTWNVP